VAAVVAIVVIFNTSTSSTTRKQGGGGAVRQSAWRGQRAGAEDPGLKIKARSSTT